MHAVTAPPAGVDAHGNPASGSPQAVERFDLALDQLLRFHPGVLTTMAALVSDEPEVPMGQILSAYLCLSSTDAPDLEAARASASTLAGLRLNEREAAHADAIGAWLAGDWHGAARTLDRLGVQWPADLLALMMGHQLDFFTGDARNLRDRVGRSLLALDPDHPHTGFVRGMQAFGLEEAGHYGQAEEAGLAALERNPDDVWATHAVAHTYEMLGRVDDGVRFLGRTVADWGYGNLFTVHLWWHLALYHLEAGRPESALAIYDAQVHHEQSAGVPLEMVDASAMLWRFLLDGADTGDRPAAIAAAWATRTGGEPWYVFNDLHAVMALCAAGRLGDARGVVDALERFVAEHPGGAPQRSNVAMTADVGLPASRAVVAFAEERYDAAAADLLALRGRHQAFGGSHAQRDVLERTLLESALRSGQHELAAALTSERLALRDTSVYGWGQRARLLAASGRVDASASAAATAALHRGRFAAAVDEAATSPVARA